MARGEYERVEKIVEAWAQDVLESDRAATRVKAVLPMLARLQPRWEAVWQQNITGPRKSSLYRAELALLARWASGEPVGLEELRSSALAAMELNDAVSEEDALHDDEGYGCALLFAALLLTALLEAAGSSDEALLSDLLQAAGGRYENETGSELNLATALTNCSAVPVRR